MNGAAGNASLRVSVAVLARVCFTHPAGGAPMLALERKATASLPTGEPQTSVHAARVHAQPFGGGMRLLNLAALEAAIGPFEFDSERSREEDDFRLLIRPEAWEAVQAFCRAHFAADGDPVLESDPARELAEEFAEALGVSLAPAQYRSRPVGALAATQLARSFSRRALGTATARIYRVFEVDILDGALAAAMLANSLRHSDDDLAEQALDQARAQGHGRANAVLALPLAELTQAYRDLPPEARAEPLTFAGHTLDANVPVVLEGVALPGFRPL